MVAALTFGVELEFSLAMLQYEAEDPNPEDHRKARGWFAQADEVEWGYPPVKSMLYLIASILNAEGIAAVVNNDGEGVDEDISHGDKWIVKVDYSVVQPLKQSMATDYTEWYGIEVVSPVLHFCDEAYNIIRLTCEIVTKNFRTKNFVSSGLHVHVGNGDSGFQLDTMKNLMAFLWTFSPQISTLHTRSDVPYAVSIQNESYLADETRFHFLINPLEPQSRVLLGLKAIYEMEYLDDLFNLFILKNGARGSWGKMEYVFYQLTEYHSDKRKRTMEWRQGAGTMDADWILAWVETISGILNMASADNQALHNLLQEAGRREVFKEEQPDMIDILEALGIERSAAYFRRTQEERIAATTTWEKSGIEWYDGGPCPVINDVVQEPTYGRVYTLN